MGQKWLFVASQKNWRGLLALEPLLWVFTGRKRNTAQAMRQGDRAVVYLTGSGQVVGLLTITGEATRMVEPVALEDGEYEYEIPVSYDLVVAPPEGVELRDLKDDLTFITNKVRWATAFQAGIVRIPDQDFDKITDRLAQSGRQ